MIKELEDKLNNLPKSWNDVTLNDYNKLTAAGLVTSEYDEETIELDIPLLIISTLTNIDSDTLESISYIELSKYIQSLGWFYKAPEDAKITYKCKEITEISYAEFITFMQYQDSPYKFVNQLLPLFYDELEGKDLNEFSIPTINALFFFALQKLKKHLRHSKLSLVKQIMMNKVKNLFHKVKM